MAVAYRASASGITSNAASMAVSATIPSADQGQGTPQATDVALAWVTVGAVQTADFVPPGGWSMVGSRRDSVSASAALYLKVLNSGDIGSTATWTYVTAGKASVVMVLASGASGSVGAGSGAVIYSTTSTTRAAPTITATGLLFEYASTFRSGGAGSWTIPSGFTSAAGGNTAGTSSVYTAAAYSTTNLAGGDTWTASTSQNNAILWSVWLVASGGTPPANTSNFFSFI